MVTKHRVQLLFTMEGFYYTLNIIKNDLGIHFILVLSCLIQFHYRY